jgi:hypothetical protein
VTARVGDLPSSRHAEAFLNDPSASGAALVALDVIIRGALIAAGIRAFSHRGSSARRQGLAGSAAIELFVLGYTLLNRPSP